MILILPLTVEEAAKLQAKARAEGTTPEQVVRQAIQTEEVIIRYMRSIRTRAIRRGISVIK
jgi:hypothetical protein